MDITLTKLLNLSDKEFDQVREIFNKAVKSRNITAKNRLNVGDTCTFKDRNGFRHFAKVSKICMKNVKLIELMDNGKIMNWTVSPSLLERV